MNCWELMSQINQAVVHLTEQNRTGPNLANSIPPPQLSHKQFLVSHYTSSFLLSPTSALEVSSVVSTLKNSRSEGADGLCILPIKESINMLASPLSHIFNLSFSSGAFPDALKIGKALPIFKNDDSSLFF